MIDAASAAAGGRTPDRRQAAFCRCPLQGQVGSFRLQVNHAPLGQAAAILGVPRQRRRAPAELLVLLFRGADLAANVFRLPRQQAERVLVHLPRRFLEKLLVTVDDGIDDFRAVFANRPAVREVDDAGAGAAAARVAHVADHAQPGKNRHGRVRYVLKRRQRAEVLPLDDAADEHRAGQQGQVDADVILHRSHLPAECGKVRGSRLATSTCAFD